MVISAICEPRSGSTNLAKWFKTKDNFTSFIEPLNVVSKEYRGYKSVFDWNYNTKHLFIKEVYRPSNKKWSNLLDDVIKFSDKVIILYRENKEEQHESFLNAVKTNNWLNKWYVGEKNYTHKQENVDYLNALTNQFKEEYFDNNDFFHISYEELYQSSDGIKRLIEFIGLEELSNDNFPFGEKYRTEKIVDKII
jgi:hypothetical protein